MSNYNFNYNLNWSKHFFVPKNTRRKNSATNSTQNKNANPPKRRKQTQKKTNSTVPPAPTIINTDTINTDTITDGHMTAEEVERHLQSKQSLVLGMFEAPATVPTEMFSNEPSLDRWGIVIQILCKCILWWERNIWKLVFFFFISTEDIQFNLFSFLFCYSESNLAETSPSILGEDVGGIELGNWI